MRLEMWHHPKFKVGDIILTFFAIEVEGHFFHILFKFLKIFIQALGKGGLGWGGGVGSVKSLAGKGFALQKGSNRSLEMQGEK